MAGQENTCVSLLKELAMQKITILMMLTRLETDIVQRKALLGSCMHQAATEIIQATAAIRTSKSAPSNSGFGVYSKD